MSAVTDHHLPLFARHELRTDRPDDTARLAELNARRQELARRLDEVRHDEAELRLSLLPDSKRQLFEWALAAIEAGEPVPGEADERMTPCPSWCEESTHLPAMSGPAWDHNGVRSDISDALGCNLGQYESGEFFVYVSDGEHTLEQARQLAAGIHRAVEVAEANRG